MRNKGLELVALVDDADWAALATRRWYAKADRYTHYAITSAGASMHRVIMNAPPGTAVDHADGNGLNNQRSNLRFATASQNGANKHRPRHNKHNGRGYMGVYKSRHRWVARAGSPWRCVGYFLTVEDAAKARDAVTLDTFGEFAATNFPVAEVRAWVDSGGLERARELAARTPAGSPPLHPCGRCGRKMPRANLALHEKTCGLTCNVPGCDKKLAARGVCTGHWTKFYDKRRARKPVAVATGDRP